jgi:hypothetical protein
MQFSLNKIAASLKQSIAAILSFDDYVVGKAKEYGIGLLKQVGETIEYETKWVRVY